MKPTLNDRSLFQSSRLRKLMIEPLGKMKSDRWLPDRTGLPAVQSSCGNSSWKIGSVVSRRSLFGNGLTYYEPVDTRLF